MNDYKRTVKKSKEVTCHNCTFYNINAECHVNDTCEVIQRSAMHNEALVYMLLQIIDSK